MYIFTENYYKELAHVIMEAEKSQDLQLASWRLRRADGINYSLFESRGRTKPVPIQRQSGRKRGERILP